MKSVMTPQQRFAQIEKPKIQRSIFDRSHGYKTCLDAGLLIPVFLEEALPGDTFNLKTTMFGRLGTPLKPVMDNMYMDIHFFSVPYRLVWDNWQKFNGEQENPGDSTSYTIPKMQATAVTGYAEDSLFDYMGLPTKIPGYYHNTLFLRAYNAIYNAWYRDENLQNSVTVRKTDGSDAAADFTVLPRGKRKDYFTSCLPWAQKATAVSIPLGTSAPVLGIGMVNQTWGGSSGSVYESDLTTSTYAKTKNSQGAGANHEFYIEGGDTNYPNIRADLSAATASTINALREAFQIQRMYEKDARGGTRYIETVKSHFGVDSEDRRLQRPEFLGGGTSSININPIAQNSATAAGTPQGNLAAMGTSTSHGHGFIKSFTEHELVLGIVSIRADLNYQQGLNRMWSRQTRFDHYWPSLANLGEQAVLKQEIVTVGTGGTTDDDVFGYNERWSEYKYKPSQVTSLFRSNATTSLDVWHLSQEFGSVPSLNAAFIVESPPVDRIVAVPAEPHFILDCYFDFKAARPMPTYSTPGMIDHF